MGFLSTAISSAANLGGALLAKSGSDKASDEIRDASNRAINISRKGKTAAKEAITTGVANQEAQLQAIARGAVPGVLTPDQKIVMDDVVRMAKNNLATGGLRGSGRAQSAVIHDVIGRTRADLYREDRDRLDRVRETLGQVRAGEGRDVANVELGHAAQAGDAVTQGARASAPYTVRGAETVGQGVIDTARSVGTSLGGFLAEEEKRAANRSYARTTV